MSRLKTINCPTITKLQLKCNVSLNVYTYQEKLVVCQVKRQYDKSKLDTLDSFYCPLRTEQWQLFEKGLNQHLDSVSKMKSSQQKRQLGEWHSVPLDNDLQLTVRRSPISSKIFCEYLLQEPEVKSEDISWILECSITKNENLNCVLLASDKESAVEYVPEKVDKIKTPLVAYKPSKKTDYVPVDSLKDCDQKTEEISYSPKPINTIFSTNMSAKSVPEYKPAPITPKSYSIRDYMCKLKPATDVKKSVSSETKEEEKEITTDIFTKAKKQLSKLDKIETISKESNIDSEYIPTKKKNKLISDVVDKVPKYIPTPITNNMSPNEEEESVTKPEIKTKLNNKKEKTLESSGQNDKLSKTKIVRKHLKKSKTKEKPLLKLNEVNEGLEYNDTTEIPHIVDDENLIDDKVLYEAIISSKLLSNDALMYAKKSDVTDKETKRKKLHRELFGSDDDDEDNNNNSNHSNNNSSNDSSLINNNKVTLAPLFLTPKSLNKSSEEESTEKKRKRRSHNECKSEKRLLKQWLQKDKGSIGSPDVTCEKFQNDCNGENSALLTHLSNREESSIKLMERMMQCEPTSTPKKVPFLSLNDLTVKELLSTFDTHKTHLDEIFQECRNRNNIRHYAGIDHCFVINLIDQKHQMKMLQKLNEIYRKEKSLLHVTVYANALLPEWIIRIFMSRYQLSREDAIERVQAQDLYRVYEESDSSLSCI